ncbi:uncharacterized protein L201_005738 [Kwoniella dendrophila CBS 6074]|uniref:Uncharacterized protein n=1 Tax=Kwoniella dendrophila CBS 6074 TaxID=1295534 RepID=A0AAX4JZU4_9TREE
MPSLLPQYRKDTKGDEESLPLFSADLENDDLDSLPAYPPRVGESSTTSATIHNVTYTFIPRWPLKGSFQDALGVLGGTKEETISIVQRGFPLLAEYPPSRIEFLSPVEMDSEGKVINDRWGKILDEAWPGFKHNPPTRLRVQVADLPGDEERNEGFPIASSSNIDESHLIQREITYIYERRWDTEFEAIGLLGRTKEETIKIVQRGFPKLKEYSSDRIEFYKNVEFSDGVTSLKHCKWVKIFDEIWEKTMYQDENPPTTLRIRIGERVKNSKIRHSDDISEDTAPEPVILAKAYHLYG